MADAQPPNITIITSSTPARGRCSDPIGALLMAIGGIGWMQAIQGNEFGLLGIPLSNPWLFFIGLLVVLYTMFGWWGDTIKEAHQGHHTRSSLHLRYGMIMFIASEVMFFVAWFWAFFDASLFYDEAQQVARAAYTGGQPGRRPGIEVLDPLHLPLYNTMILLLSGTTVTWAHHALLHGDRKGLKWGLTLTIVLGMIFSSVQAYEYAVRRFLQGFALRLDLLHGDRLPRLPRPVGTIFLIVCLIRAMPGALHAETAFRLRGGRLVLALR
jgi:cytochrome c oxidase subunit 3